MPISIEEFESRYPAERRTNAERILAFLAGNPTNAYRAVEIAEATGVDENSVHPVLHRLEGRDLVRHRRPYWAIGDQDAVREAPPIDAVAALLEGDLGPDRPEEWVQAAREHFESGDEAE